jgi:peptide/nickel transport system substrate-binding protein
MRITGGPVRRTGALLASGVGILLLLSACGSSSSSKSSTKVSLEGSSGVSKSAACSATPVNGGNLVYERQAAAETLDPLNPKNGNGDIFAYNQIYSGLVRSDPTGQTNKIVPSLAERWTVSADGKTYTFFLRPGLKFSNGQPVTADDVAWTLNRFGNPKIKTIMAAVAGGFGHATVVNPSTVSVQLTRPVSAFLYDISIWPAFILPRSLVEKEGAAFFNHPVGTGAFKVQSYVKGSYITMVRNPHYWESGKPHLNSVRYNFVTDSNTRILALQSGSAQEMDVVPFSQVPTLRSAKNIEVQSAKVPLFLGLWLNHARKPFADLNVRKAIQYAIDRPLINKEIIGGLGTIPNSVLMSFAMDAPDSVVKPYPYDVAKAKSLIAQSTFPHGFSTTLTYPSGTDFYKQLGLALQQEFGAIGIKVKLIEQDTATVTNDWATRAYDMVFPFASFTSDITVPDEYADFLANWGNGFMGFNSNWRDPTINAQVLHFESTLNQSQRAQEWAQIQQTLMNVTPVMNVLSLPFVNAHGSNVCGTYLDGLGSDHLEDTWIAHSS